MPTLVASSYEIHSWSIVYRLAASARSQRGTVGAARAGCDSLTSVRANARGATKDAFWATASVRKAGRTAANMLRQRWVGWSKSDGGALKISCDLPQPASPTFAAAAHLGRWLIPPHTPANNNHITCRGLLNFLALSLAQPNQPCLRPPADPRARAKTTRAASAHDRLRMALRARPAAAQASSELDDFFTRKPRATSGSSSSARARVPTPSSDAIEVLPLTSSTKRKRDASVTSTSTSTSGSKDKGKKKAAIELQLSSDDDDDDAEGALPSTAMMVEHGALLREMAIAGGHWKGPAPAPAPPPARAQLNAHASTSNTAAGSARKVASTSTKKQPTTVTSAHKAATSSEGSRSSKLVPTSPSTTPPPDLPQPAPEIVADFWNAGRSRPVQDAVAKRKEQGVKNREAAAKLASMSTRDSGVKLASLSHHRLDLGLDAAAIEIDDEEVEEDGAHGYETVKEKEKRQRDEAKGARSPLPFVGQPLMRYAFRHLDSCTRTQASSESGPICRAATCEAETARAKGEVRHLRQAGELLVLRVPPRVQLIGLLTQVPASNLEAHAISCFEELQQQQPPPASLEIVVPPAPVAAPKPKFKPAVLKPAAAPKPKALPKPKPPKPVADGARPVELSKEFVDTEDEADDVASQGPPAAPNHAPPQPKAKPRPVVAEQDEDAGRHQQLLDELFTSQPIPATRLDAAAKGKGRALPPPSPQPEYEDPVLELDDEDEFGDNEMDWEQLGPERANDGGYQDEEWEEPDDDDGDDDEVEIDDSWRAPVVANTAMRKGPPVGESPPRGSIYISTMPRELRLGCASRFLAYP